jgi:type I restriction enzyme S subunit
LVAPKLRFKEFTDNYSSIELGEILSFFSTNSLAREYLGENGKIANIHYGDIHMVFPPVLNADTENLPLISESAKFSAEKATLCNDGDILVADASEDYADIGKTTQIINTHKKLIVGGLHVLHCRDTHHKTAGCFLAYYLNSSWVHRQIQVLATGAKVLGISKSNLGRVVLNLPSKWEQERISTFMNLYYKKCELQREKIEALNKEKQRIVNMHFNQQHGKQVRYKSIYTKAGEGGTPSTAVAEFYEGGEIPFVKIEHLCQKYLRAVNSYITSRGLVASSAWIVPKNSVIFSNGATIGAVSINLLPVTTKQGILGIVPNEKITTEYLYYLMSSHYFRHEVYRITTCGTMYTAYLKDIDGIKIYIPTIAEQTRFVDVIKRVDLKITLEQQKFDKLQQFKKGLLQQLFV